MSDSGDGRPTVLVTGGAGFVGSHTCKALAKAGFLPVTYDSLERGNDWAVKWGPLEEGDLADHERLKSVLKHHEPKAVLHFAAYAYVGESIRFPTLYRHNIVDNTLELLSIMVENGISNLVYSSSGSTYGATDRLPISEDHPQRPESPYAASKVEAEGAVKEFAANKGLNAMIFRYFNATGADPDGEIGEYRNPEPHLIPGLIAAVREARPQATIFGDDYDTPDGTCIRDYVHVSDLADAHVLGLGHIIQRGGCDVLNLGVGTGHSVRDVVEVVEDVMETELEIHVEPRRKGDAPALVADSSRARRNLGWKPKFPELEVQVRHACRWHDQSARIGRSWS